MGRHEVDIPESEVWGDILDAFKPDERPLNSMTVQEMAARWGCRQKTAKTRLDNLVKEGKLQTAQLRIPAKDGRLREQWVYWASSG